MSLDTGPRSRGRDINSLRRFQVTMRDCDGRIWHHRDGCSGLHRYSAEELIPSPSVTAMAYTSQRTMSDVRHDRVAGRYAGSWRRAGAGVRRREWSWLPPG
jgi:hypothetical protein